ncbi:MAG: response regulator [Bryobacterales bacterium]|nr:response regulator [Bryobacterales bacterium]
MAGSGSNPSPGKGPPSPSPSPSEPSAGRRRPRILLVEDNGADVFLIRESLQAAQLHADLHILPDGEKAIRFFEDADADPSAPCPDLVLLDINLPRRSGHEVARHLRGSRRCACTPIVVVTSSDSERDRQEMARLGVNAYFRKPSDYASYLQLGSLVKTLLAAAL